MQQTQLEIKPQNKTDQVDAFSDTPELVLLNGGNPPGSTVPLPSMPLAEFEFYAEDWVEDSRAGQSPATSYGKADTVKKFMEFTRKSKATKVGAKEFKRFIGHVMVGHLTPGGRFDNKKLCMPPSERTVEYYYNYLRGLVNWMMSDPDVPLEVDIMRGVSVPKPAKKQIQPFTPEEIEALLEAARRGPNPKRDEAILLFMLDTGARASEVVTLGRKGMTIQARGGVAKVLGKGKKERFLPFSREASKAVWAYYRTIHVPVDYVFLASRGREKGAPLTANGLLQLYERLGRAAGLKGVRCSPHTMRHTFAINFLRNGGNVFALQMILGHTALHQTQKYVAIAQSDIEQQQRDFSVADHMRRRSRAMKKG